MVTDQLIKSCVVVGLVTVFVGLIMMMIMKSIKAVDTSGLGAHAIMLFILGVIVCVVSSYSGLCRIE